MRSTDLIIKIKFVQESIDMAKIFVAIKHQIHCRFIALCLLLALVINGHVIQTLD